MKVHKTSKPKLGLRGRKTTPSKSSPTAGKRREFKSKAVANTEARKPSGSARNLGVRGHLHHAPPGLKRWQEKRLDRHDTRFSNMGGGFSDAIRKLSR